MPLINGQKMACEPCIRGHRSTKCTHANERLMVPVRKPGRPLSSCPHPSSRPCACAAVTAAIPRKQKCGCGSSASAAADHKTERETSSSAATPPSPSKATGSGFRVQKQGSKGASSRKQSVDLASLQRMDSNQLNIIQPGSGMPGQAQSATPSGQSTPMSNMGTYNQMGMGSPENFGTESGMFPMFQFAMPSPLMSSASSTSAVNGHADASSTTTPAAKPVKSCCGGASNGVKNQTDPTQLFPPTPDPSVNGSTDHKPKSCCSSTPSTAGQDTKPPVGMMAPPVMPFQPNGVNGVNGVMMQAFQNPLAMQNGVFPFYVQPNVFNYPPQFGSYLQPLQPDQWRQMMAAMSFAHHGGNVPFSMAGPMPMAQTASTTTNSSNWTSHQCGCGDSCQCVGCAAHPYNEATQNYVRSAWNTMNEDAQKANGHTNGHANGTHAHIDSVANGSVEEPTTKSTSGATTPIKTSTDGNLSPAAPQTPSDAPSGLSEEQALSASDFFFVSYPFGDSCAGETASCPCGDDCQCIGCAIHNNPDPSLITESSTA